MPHLLQEEKSNTIAFWDGVGIAASVLCLLHCLVLPLVPALLTLLSLIGLSFLKEEGAHQWVALFIVATCGFAFIPGYRRHRRRHVLVAMVAGLSLILVGAFTAGAWWGARSETILTVAGGVCLVTAHLLNLRYTRFTAPGDPIRKPG